MARFSLISHLLLIYLVASACFIVASQAGAEGSLRPDQCKGACDNRCTIPQRDACLLACNQCCAKCLCVPSGAAYRNREECICYGDMLNPKGVYACP